jgi:3-oxoadipate enol-lactonase
MAAMSLAARHPDRVDRLVVISASARFPDPRPWIDRARHVLDGGTSAVAEGVVARWTTPAWQASNEQDVADMRAMFDRADPAGYAWCCLALASMDLRPRLGDIRAAALVLCGRADQSIPPAQSEAIAAGIANARLELIEDAAHLPSTEQPEVVAELIDSHLQADRQENS